MRRAGIAIVGGVIAGLLVHFVTTIIVGPNAITIGGALFSCSVTSSIIAGSK